MKITFNYDILNSFKKNGNSHVRIDKKSMIKCRLFDLVLLFVANQVKGQNQFYDI